MTLKLINSVSKKEYSYVVEDTKTSVYYFNFNLKLENVLDEGQYDYFLLEGDDILARGIAQIGEFKPEKTEYENKKTYITYNG